MILMLAHAALSLSLSVPQEPARHQLLRKLDAASIEQYAIAAISGRKARAATAAQHANRLSWLPWAGAAAGATLVGIGVADEEDLVLSGKLMWIGVGAAAGAGAGWLIAKLAR